MANDEYQRQLERGRQRDEARRRQGIEDMNRAQREKAAREAEASRKNYSRFLGSHGMTPPILGPGVDGPTYDRARAGYEAQKRMTAQFNQSFSSTRASSGGGGGVSGGHGGSKAGAAFVVLLVILGIVIFGSHGSSHSPQNSNSTTASEPAPNPAVSSESGSPIPKPSPLGTERSTAVQPLPQPVPGTVAPPAPNPQSALGDGTTTATPEAAGAGVGSTAPSPVAPSVKTYAASRDGFNNGCERGELVLAAASLTFTCPSDSSKSVSVNAANVLGVDKNGIAVSPKEKYHFHIAGMHKDDVGGLFAQWLQSAKAGPGGSGN